MSDRSFQSENYKTSVKPYFLSKIREINSSVTSLDSENSDLTEKMLIFHKNRDHA